MKKYFQLLGAAALLTASLFTINETAKAESMETFTERRVVFKCEMRDDELITIPQYVEQERYERYENTVAEEYVVLEANKPLITWNNYLGNNGQYTPKSRCYTVSARLTNMTSAIAAYYRYGNSTLSNDESYTKALEALEAVSQHTLVYGTNRFGQYIDEQILVASDQKLSFASWLKRNITVAGRPTDPDQTIIVTLSPENARRYREVLESFKTGILVAAGGEGSPNAELPIEE